MFYLLIDHSGHVMNLLIKPNALGLARYSLVLMSKSTDLRSLFSAP